MAKKAEPTVEEPCGECYADGTPAMVGDLCLFPTTNSQGKKTRREGLLAHVAVGATTSNGVVAYAEMGIYGTVHVKLEHVTLSSCEKSGLESEW